MRQINPKADPLAHLPHIHPARIPRHIAFIMDGNGRWAEERGFPRIFGHRNGASAVRSTVEQCGRLGVECVTLYSFSNENWKRPQGEIDALMAMAVMYCDGEREAFIRENIRVRFIGSRKELPTEVVQAMENVEAATASCTGPMLCLALNYGSRQEIANAARTLAEKVRKGELSPDKIDEHTLTDALYTRGIPDPDLVVRTAGEFRVSNFLLWQLSYAELYVTPCYWPDFDHAALHKAIIDYASRDRRFGGVQKSSEHSA
ncbi:MAG: isoprenyl transferase [Planctomycetes bacterium]|nr:isoprenyl transferase [Planctomycetota bacterium]